MRSGEHDDRPELGDEPPALVEPPAPPRLGPPTEPTPVAEPAGIEPAASAPAAEEPAAGEPAEEEPAPTEPTGIEPAPTEPTATTEPAATQPTETAVPPPHPTFAIDTWLDAPPGTFPGLADGPPDEFDSAFAPDRFREYEDDVLPSDERRPAAAGVSPYGMPPDDAPDVQPRTRPGAATVLVGVCIAVIAVVAIVASFAGGRAVGRIGEPDAVSASPTPRASSSAAPAVPTSLAAPGIQPWDRLGGGECLTSYTGPWAEAFTVVDCRQQHTAQLILRSRFTDARKAAYPGATALQQRMAALCTAPGVVDLSRAASTSDLQVSSAYPAIRSQWESGDRDYFCFVSRQSGAPISGSVAGTAQQEVWAARAPRPSASATSKPAG